MCTFAYSAVIAIMLSSYMFLSVRDGDRVAEQDIQNTAIRTAFVEGVGGGSGPPKWRKQLGPGHSHCQQVQRSVC